MNYFTWKEKGLTSDCDSLEAMAARFEEAASLMRRLAKEGFVVQRNAKGQQITHTDPEIFESWGFISEEPPVNQLTLMKDFESE